MSFSKPFPEIIEDAIIYIAKDFLGTDMSMIVGPSSDHKVEFPYHLPRFVSKIGFDDLLGFGDNRLN